MFVRGLIPKEASPAFLIRVEVIEEFAYSARIPFGWGIARVLKPTCKRTVPLTPTGVIEPASVRGQLSKSHVGQV